MNDTCLYAVKPKHDKSKNMKIKYQSSNMFKSDKELVNDILKLF